jgi:hypothetical protein
MMLHRKFVRVSKHLCYGTESICGYTYLLSLAYSNKSGASFQRGVYNLICRDICL